MVEPRGIPILDRIGDDGLVGDLLYGILWSWEPGKWVRFGWPTGALITPLVTDYGLPLDEEQVWAIYEGNAKTRRLPTLENRRVL